MLTSEPLKPVPSHAHRLLFHVTASATSLDQKLFQLQAYFEQRLRTWQAPSLPASMADLTIDLGVLGTRDYGAAPVSLPDWPAGPVYPLRLERSQVLLGPLYQPAQTASPCPHCLERRWAGMRPREMQLAWLSAQSSPVTGSAASLTGFALETIWQTFAALLHVLSTTHPSDDILQNCTVVDLLSLETSQYRLLKDSACPVCSPGEADTPEAAILHLSSRSKLGVTTYHTQKATEYDLPVSGLVNPVSGALGSVVLPLLSSTLTAPISGQFFMRNDFTVYEAWWGGHANSFQQSLAVGLLEAMERYAGYMPHGKKLQCFESYDHIAADALDPRTCGLYSESFYQHNVYAFRPFDPARPLWWVWGYSLGQKRPMLVPEQLVYYMYKQDKGGRFVQESSNGCAIGSCIEEAILHGLFELIERDAFLLTWYAQLAPPRIDPRSSQQRETLFLLEKIEQQGYELYLFDTRLDIRIPSVIGIARRKEPGLGNIVVAAGCSLDPEDAIRGALCEIASYIPGVEDRIRANYAQLQEMVHDYSKVQQLTHHGELYGLPEMADKIHFFFQNPLTRSVEETYRDWQAQCPRTLDLRDDVLYCIDQLARLGLDVIVVEQTAPEQRLSGLRTACVIVPGLLPLDFGWGRERALALPRLRTVPRTAGYRQTDFTPDPATIIPHPFP
jgi:ribosomal protein S12 methylthiotransferase accessory factor